MSALETGRHLDEPDTWQTHLGSYDDVFDAMTGDELDPQLVSASRREEMELMKDVGAHVYNTIELSIKATGKLPCQSLGWTEQRRRVTVQLIRSGRRCRGILEDAFNN